MVRDLVAQTSDSKLMSAALRFLSCAQFFFTLWTHWIPKPTDTLSYPYATMVAQTHFIVSLFTLPGLLLYNDIQILAGGGNLCY
jgi:hypothetical protein